MLISQLKYSWFPFYHFFKSCGKMWKLWNIVYFGYPYNLIIGVRSFYIEQWSNDYSNRYLFRRLWVEIGLRWSLIPNALAAFSIAFQFSCTGLDTRGRFPLHSTVPINRKDPNKPSLARKQKLARLQESSTSIHNSIYYLPYSRSSMTL